MSTRLLTDVRFRHRVAGTDPAKWMMQPEFWRGQRAFAVILGVSLLGIVVLAPFTYSGPEALVSLFVQGLAVWGVAIAARGLAAADVDLALAAELEERASRYLSGLAGGGEKRMDLDRLERTLVPNNPAVPVPGPIRVFQQICKEARDRRFESASTLVQPYRDESTEDLFRLQNLQKIALWVGILGTFVGLLIALEESGGAPAGGEELTALVERMYGGLYVAFTASVAGLEVAIILSFVLLVLRKRQELCFAQMESVAVTLLSAARRAINHDDFVHEFAQVNTAVRGLADRMYEHTQGITGRMGELERRLREQNDRIDSGLERLAGAGSEFERFLRNVSDAEHRFLGDLAELFEAASFRDLAQTLREGARQVEEQLAGRLDDIASRGDARLEAFDASVQGLAAAVEAHAAGFASSVDRLETEVTAASARNAEAVLAACARIAPEAERRGGAPRSSEAALELLASRVAELDVTLRRLASRRGPTPREVLSSLASRWWGLVGRYRG